MVQLYPQVWIDSHVVRPDRPLPQVIVGEPVEFYGRSRGTVWDDGTEFAVLIVKSQIDGGADEFCRPTGPFGSLKQWANTLVFSSAGRHVVRVWCHDAQAGEAEAKVTVEAVVRPPSLSLVDVPSRTGVARFAVAAATSYDADEVTFSLDGGAAIQATFDTAAQRWRHTVQLPFSEVPAGGRRHSLIARAVNASGAASTASRDIVAVDDTPPLVEFTPADGTRLNGTSQGAPCPVVITVSDPSDGDRLHSGIASVRCGLDGALADLAPDDAARTFWRTILDVPARGSHSIDVQVSDVQGNVTEQRHRVLVVLPLTVPSIDPGSYLDDLLTFAARRLRDEPGGSRVGTGRLTEALCQPFSGIASAPPPLTALPVHSLRLVTEALVEHLRPRRPAALASWSLDEGSGGVAREAVGGHDGRLVGAAWAPGRDGRSSLHVDGTGAHVAVAGADPDLRIGQRLTLAAWIRPDGPGGDPVQGGVVLCKEGEYGLARFADGTLRWTLANAQPGWGWVNTGWVTPQGTWTHVALVYDGRTVSTYVDGVRRHTAEGTGDIGDADPGRDELWIGARQDAAGGLNQSFNGAMADVLVFDRALSPWDVCVLAEQAPDTAASWSATAVTENPPPLGPRPPVLPLPGPPETIRRFVYRLPGHPLAVGRGDRLRLAVSRVARSPLSSLALELRDDTGGLRVLVWGPRRQLGTLLEVRDRIYVGPLPEGESMVLEVPVRRAALERRVVTAIAVTANGDVLPGEVGRVPWWQAEDLVEGASRYRLSTYDAVLGTYGCSLAELRASRGAGDADRQALADRLGIGVSELSALPAAETDVTDEALARWWGVPRPDADPLAPVSPGGLVLDLQKAVLVGRWRDQDHRPATPPGDETPVLDPDLIEQSWLDLPALAGDAGRLLRERRAWTAAERARLTVLASGGDATSVVDRLVADVRPGLNLDDLGRRQREGEDIVPLLLPHHLTPLAFSRLAELRGVAAVGPLLPSEVEEVCDILVQAGKGVRRGQWSDAERDAGVVIGPGLFAVVVEAQTPQPSWRVSWRQWQLLRDRVAARRAEVAACLAAAQRALEEAEDAGLPALRDVLVRAITGGGLPVPTGDIEDLSRRLLIDVDAAAGQWTTRSAQAADALQRLMFGVRTGRLAALASTSWSDDSSRLRLDQRPGYGLEQFDQEWPWMGSYERWAAAISLLLFPGSHLEPAQWATRPQASTQYRALADILDALPQTAASARAAVTGYWAGSATAPGLASELGADGDYQALQALSPGFALTEQLSDVEREAVAAVETRLFVGRTIAAVPPWMQEVFLLVPLMVARALQSSGQFLPALDWLRLVYDHSRPEPVRIVCAGLPATAVEPPPLRPDEWLTETELDPYVYAGQRPSAYLRAAILLSAGCLVDFADSEFAADSSESRSRAQGLYDAAGELLGAAALPPPEATPADAALDALRRRASVNRLKLRQRRNLAGLQRPSTDGRPGQGLVASPTNYRYGALLARAQQLVASAAQVEAAYLRALEQTDAEAYTLLRARQDLQLAEQRVVVQRLNASAARDEVAVTAEQRDRARLQADTYADWLARGLNSHEQDMLASYRQAADYRIDAAYAEADMSAAGVFNALGSIVSSGLGGYLNFVGSGLAAVYAGERANALAALARTEAKAQRSAFMAQYERRRQEWLLQWRVAEADHAAALALVAVAQQRAAVAETEAAITNPNGAVTHLRYGPLGLPRATWVGSTGAANAGEGSAALPDAEYAYDLLAFARTRDDPAPQPAYVHTTTRTWAGPGSPVLVQESRQYVDGLGRIAQRRSSAEDVVYGPDSGGLSTDPATQPLPARADTVLDRVAVDGRQVHDNKGRPVEKHPPRFSRGFGYETSGDDPALRVSLRYDPRGHLVRTLNADGSQQRVCFGRPGAGGPLALDFGADGPAGFEPTAWELLTYDANDLAAVSTDPATGASLAGHAPPAHRGTPQTRVLDARGRVRAQIDRLTRNPEGWLVTTFDYDGSGTMLGCRDPGGRDAWRRSHDLLGRPWRVQTLDAGPRTMVVDALGAMVRFRDAEGAVVEHEYDDANRLTKVWAVVRRGADRHLHERLDYGSAAARIDLRGRLLAHRDGAGLLRNLRYDLRGNVTARQRRVVSDAVLAGVAADADWVPAWERPGADTMLDTAAYVEDTAFDSAGRPHTTTFPAMADGHRAVVQAAYGRSGLLVALTLDGDPLIGALGYDPAGHRVLLDHGNGLLTRFAHDLRTSQLFRLRTELCRFDAATSSYLSQAAPIRDTGYFYDLVGNVTAVVDRVTGCGVSGNPGADTQPDRELRDLLLSGDALVRDFRYDALYRLTSATGRSLDLARSFADIPGLGAYRPPDPPGDTALRLYRETYTYDVVGNLRALRYVAGDHRWVRRIGLAGLDPGVEVTPGDIATSMVAGGDRRSYGYDAEGRLRSQGASVTHRWDPWGRLLTSRLRAEGGPGTSVRHLHDAFGRRVKTWWRSGGEPPRSTTYPFGTYEDRRWTAPDGSPRRSTTLVVSDGPFPLAQVRRGDAESSALPARTHHLVDHLGSHALVTDEAGLVVVREEYFPWGETSLGGSPGSTFRFTGKERDPSTGLYAGGSRWYLPELGRWSGPDPRGPVDGLCLYGYARNNPLTRVDDTGGQSRPATVQLPADLVAPEMGRAAAQFRENPVSWQGVKALLFGFAWTYSGRAQDAQGQPLTSSESRAMASRNLSLMALYALGLGQNTAKWLHGSPYDASAVKEERLANSLALLGVATRGLRLFGVARGLMTENRVFALNQAMGSPLAGASHPGILLNPSRETLLAMVAQERHILRVTHLPSDTSFWVVSGPGGQLGHTEYAAARYLQAQGRLNAGDSLLLQGYLAACNPKGAGAVCCHHLLDYLSRTKGLDVLYEADSLAADLGRVSGGSRYYQPGAGHILQSTGEAAAAPTVAQQILSDFSGP